MKPTPGSRWKLIAIILLLLAGSVTVWAAPPKPRPLLLLAPFTGEKLVIRALSATMQGAVLSVEMEDDRKGGWDRAALVATLPWYTDAELFSRTVNLSALVAVYENADRAHPEFHTGLAAEVARVRMTMATLERDRKANVASILTQRYDPAEPYTPDALRQRIRTGEETAALSLDEAPAIEKALAPLRDHLSNLEAGRTFYEHRWRTPDEMRRLKAQADEAARLNAISARLSLPLNTQLVDASRMTEVLAAAGLAVGLPVILGIVLVVRRKRPLGIALIVLPLAGSVVYAGLLFSADPEVPVPTDADAGATEIARIIDLATSAQTTAAPPADRVLHVSESDVNAFLSRHVQLQGAPAAGAINLKRVAAQLTNGGAIFDETAEWHGQRLNIEYRYDIQVVDDQPIIADAVIRIGKAPVPAPLQGWLRTSLTPPLKQFFAAHDPLAAYTLAPLVNGGTDLVSTAPTPAPIVQSAPEPSSISTGTPASVPTPPPAAAIVPAAPVMAERTPEPENDKVDLPPLSAVGVTPGPDNTFYVYAIWDGINSASDHEIEEQMDRLRAQFGKGNRFHRIGFAFILGGSESRLQTICSIARRKDIAIGVILGAQTHSGAGKNEVQEDYRAVQWRLSGAEWRGGNGPRDAMLPTPSRYCKLVRDALEKTQRQHCDMLRAVMNSYPGVITCINSTIEEELADGGQTSDDKLADYSPYAVTEFRDWLRHTGEYDADTGKYAGQGAPAEITGAYTFAKGKLRSPFYGASDPDTSSGNSSFNQRFSTHFKTWSLKYWDLQAFPGRITDEQFNPTPDSGPGFTDGGFDAPRKRDSSSWWHAWSWDYQDNSNRNPPGKPDDPAYGFRQVMVHHFVEDMFQVAIRARLPANLMFAHQIPGELAGAPRDRSAATPVWTGFLPFNGTVGVTRFGSFDPELALRYTRTNPESRGWGIFEWHPKPNAAPDDPKLYQAATDGLRNYYRARCHHLFAGWWHSDPAKDTKDFPLADSQFAKAIKDFMNSRPDQPYPGAAR